MMIDIPVHVQHPDPDVTELLTVADAVATDEINVDHARLWARRILPNTDQRAVHSLLGNLVDDLIEAVAYDTSGHVHVNYVDDGGWRVADGDDEANNRRDAHRATARLAAELAVSVDRRAVRLAVVR